MIGAATLEELSKIEPLLIGTIARAYEKAANSGHVELGQLARLWRKRFGHRLDYQIWWERYSQSLKLLPLQTTAARLAPPSDPYGDRRQIELSFHSRPANEQWGVVASLLSTNDEDWNELTLIPGLMKQWLHSDPAPLEECPAYCAIVILRCQSLLLDVDIARNSPGHIGWSGRYAEYVEQCDRTLETLDPLYDGFTRPTFDRLAAEDDARMCLMPVRPMALQHLLTRCLNRALRFPILILKRTGERPTFSQRTARQAFACAYACWRLAISRYHILSKHSFKAGLQAETAVYGSLRTAAFAAAAANEKLVASSLWHWYQMTIPDRLLQDFDHRPPPWTAKVVKQAGLLLDKRLHLPFDQTLRSDINPRLIVPRVGRVHASQERTHTLREARPDIWKVVEARWGTPQAGINLEEYAYSIAINYDKRLADHQSTEDQAVIHALIRILRKFGYVNSAVDMLALRRPPTAGDLVGVAVDVQRAMSQSRLGLDDVRVRSWFQILRSALGQCGDDERLRSSWRHRVHEGLLGRHISIKESLGEHEAELAMQLSVDALSLDGSLTQETIRRNMRRFLFEKTEGALRRGPGVIDARKLVESLAAKSATALGPAFAVSIVACSSGTSIFWASNSGSDGCWFPGLRLHSATDVLMRTVDYWFISARRSFADQIPWPPDYDRLASFILEKLEQQLPQPQVLLLAVDSELPRLPWQHLFQSIASRHGRSAPIVSLVPNLGWIHLSTRWRRASGFERRNPPLRVYCQSDDPDVVRARSSITQIDKEASWRSVEDVGVVLGHGEQADSGHQIPTVTVNGVAIGFKQWLEIAQQRSVLLHSCWTGNGLSGRLGDLGSLVGLLLGGKCRAVIAPIGRVPVEAVETMHAAVIGGVAREHIGVRVQQAISRDPAASLYTLYGDPYLIV